MEKSERNFHSLIIDDLMSSPQGSLLFLSKGLGIFPLLSKFLLTKAKQKPFPPLIFLLNFEDEETNALKDTYKSLENSPPNITIANITTEPSTKRKKFYMQGGIYSISAVVLVFDLLQKVLSPLIITGLIINKMERVKQEIYREAWIATLVRLETNNPFIIGIIENFEADFDIQKLLKAFYLKKVFLWPSCRLEVQQSLSNYSLNLNNEGEINKDLNKEIEKTTQEEHKAFRCFEIYVKPSALMRKIQDGLLLVMQSLLNDVNKVLRKNSSTAKEIRFEEITSLPNYAFLRKLVKIKEYNENSTCLLKDLSSFRNILNNLTNDDSCSFYKKLLSSRENSANDSIWLLGEKQTRNDLEKLISNAKKRVYEVKELKDNSVNNVQINADGNTILQKEQFFLKSKIHLNLELNPKLEALKKVLSKIETRINEVLLINNSEKRPLIWIHTTSEIKAKEIRDFLHSFYIKKDQQLLRMCSNLFFLLNNSLEKMKRRNLIKDFIQKKKNENFNEYEQEAILLENCREDLEALFPKLKEISILSQQNVSQENLIEMYKTLLQEFCLTKGLLDLDLSQIKPADINVDLQNDLVKENEIFRDFIPKTEIIVNCLKKPVLRYNFLRFFSPDFIIFYDPDPVIIREFLINTSLNPKTSPWLYILMYKNSLESSLYLSQTQRENQLFESILKESLIVPMEETPQNRIKNLEEVYKSLNTRAPTMEKTPMIIVDKREFHSNLPSVLFHEGFIVVPRFLDKGDYILSDEICVERKSVKTGDLLESLKGGRLEKQIKKILESFKKCVILLDFAEKENFSFQEKNNNIDKNSLNSDDEEKNQGEKNGVFFMLAAIAMKFPNRISFFWPRGYKQIINLFLTLKKGAKEPDLSKFVSKSEEKEDEETFMELYEKIMKKDKDDEENNGIADDNANFLNI